MASTLLALYAWLTSNAIALDRVRDSAKRLEDQRSALALVETINPMATPEGEIEAEDLRVAWTARALTEERMAITRANLPSAFDVALYELQVEVRREGAAPSAFTVRRAGWRLRDSMVNSRCRLGAGGELACATLHLPMQNRENTRSNKSSV